MDKKMPTLFFIHGAGQSSIFWEAQLIGLLQFANTIAVDLPGHGDSVEQETTKIEDYSELLLAFLKKINPPSPVVCGLSMGGAIAQHLALPASKIFKSAILINTGAKLRVLPKIISTVESDYNKYITMFINMSTAKNNLIDSTINKIIRCSSGGSKITANDFRLCNKFNMMETVCRINLPTLIITGKEDKLTPVKYGRYLVSQIPNSIHVNIDKVGHMSPIERPKEINDVIIKFLIQTEVTKTLL